MKRLVGFLAVLALIATVGCGVGSAPVGTARSFSLAGSTPPKIAFLSDRDGLGLYQLYYMNVDGSEQNAVPLSPTFDGLVWDPEISPDGTQIVFSKYGSGVADLYSVGLDGSNVTQLTSDFDSYAPHFSPDGTQIVFIRYSDTGYPHVWTMNPDGSAAIDLTPASEHRYSSAYFSPDGLSIIAVRNNDPNASSTRPGNMKRSVASGGFGNEIVTMNLDGSSLSVVESITDNNGGVQYSSDSSSLIYSIDSAGTVVVSESLASHVRTPLTPADSDNQSPKVWGTYIFFTSQRDGNMAIYRMDADGSNQVQLTDPANNNRFGMIRH